MKGKFLLWAAVALFLFLAVPATYASDCSCTAPDNSCSCSVSCPREGCAAVCAEGGKCVCCCASACPELLAPLSLDVTQVPVGTVVQILSKASGQRVEAVSGSDQLVTLKLVKATLMDAVRELQNVPGVRIRVNGHGPLTSPLPPSARVSVCFTGAKPRLVLRMIKQATGWDLEFESPPTQAITLKATGTLAEITQKLSEVAGVSVRLVQADNKKHRGRAT